MTDTENLLTLSRLLSETAQLNHQLLQMQIDRLENELVLHIEPLQKLLVQNTFRHLSIGELSLPALHEKLTCLQHLKFELNQTEMLCRAA
ncbi:MAG: hypothetical protein KKB51_02725 [Candidatus Riflebacteria bacterium]|nr:hypothetical protein [Candidatus Riflebacteria bacterium]